MARPRYPRSDEPLPPPLPPETRTVGQLVAETLKLYGRHFWRALPLGLPFALVTQANLGRDFGVQLAVLFAGAPLLTAAYVAASSLALDAPLTRETALRAFAAGVLVFLPVPLLLLGFVLPALAWLGLVGLAVPAIVVERLGLRDAFRRAVALARADYVHAVGSLATLLLLVVLTRLMLAIVLRSQGETTDRAAALLADVVLSPLLYLGAALLYTDQAARLIHSDTPSRTRRRRRDADLHPADDADRAGGADPQVQSRPAARGQR